MEVPHEDEECDDEDRAPHDEKGEHEHEERAEEFDVLARDVVVDPVESGGRFTRVQPPSGTLAELETVDTVITKLTPHTDLLTNGPFHVILALIHTISLFSNGRCTFHHIMDVPCLCFIAHQFHVQSNIYRCSFKALSTHTCCSQLHKSIEPSHTPQIHIPYTK